MKSKKFSLVATSAISTVLLMGCQSDYSNVDQFASRNTAVCVDKRTQRRIADDECRRGGHSSGGYGWYFINRGGAMPYMNDRPVGGSFTRPSGSYFTAPASTQVTRAAAIQRGGFGSTARSFSAGE